jgi:superfamily II DNA or RNA helicase
MGRITVTHLDALKDFTQGVIAYSGYDLRSFDCWICDEVHRLPVPSRLQFLPLFRPVYSWGLTATPERADNSHTLNEVVFGPVLFSSNHKETPDLRAKTGEKGIVPFKVMVFPLATDEPVPDDLPLFSKVRKVYLKNPKMQHLLVGILSSIPDFDTAKLMIFVDTRRLGLLISKWTPGFTFVHGLHSLDYRRNVLDKFKAGEQTKIICADIWSEGIDVPDLAYVIDCSAKLSPNRIIQRAGRAAPSAGNKASGYYIMLISTTSPQLFNQGITKLKGLNDLGLEIQFLFDREYARALPFEQAPLLAELGQFA